MSEQVHVTLDRTLATRFIRGDRDGKRYMQKVVNEALKAALVEGDGGEGREVLIRLDPECIEGENVREFYPEAVGAATGALKTMLSPEDDARAHRDADILASCAVSEALKALVTVAGLSDSGLPTLNPKDGQQ